MTTTTITTDPDTLEVVTTVDGIEMSRTPMPDEQANQQRIANRAAAALVANTTFIDLPSPTNAQAAAQVKALTRQVNGLIRVVLGHLDSDT